MSNLKYFIPIIGWYYCIKALSQNLLNDFLNPITAVWHGSIFSLLMVLSNQISIWLFISTIMFHIILGITLHKHFYK
jgi:hypothetical protein